MTEFPQQLESTPTRVLEELLELPRTERRDALELLVSAEFKSILLMTEDEELPLTTSYFELGFTSLRITEVKQRLEDLLGRPLSTNLLFNSPTVEQLLDYLAAEVLPELFSRPA